MIAKAQCASAKIDCNATMTTSSMQQSFFYFHIARSNGNKTTNAREGQTRL
jgi:hypothetical protein